MVERYFKIQETIRASGLRSSLLTVEAGAFTCFLHPDDPAHYANYAIPNRLLDGVKPAEIQRLVEVFAQHNRRARLEFLAPCAPGLEEALHRAGFITESETMLMICSAASLQEPEPVPGLEVTPLGPDSDLEAYREYFTVQMRAFGEGTEPEAPLAAAEEFRRRFGGMYKLLGRMDGKAVGVGLVTFPTDEIAEVAGIGTLPGYRRRGIAGNITYRLARHSLENGLEFLFLTAANEAAGRVYERVGFLPTGARQVNISLPG